MNLDQFEKYPGGCQEEPCILKEDLDYWCTAVILLGHNDWLYISEDEDGFGEGGMFTFIQSEVDNTKTLLQPIFTFSGAIPGLKELRHIWWAPMEQDSNFKGYTYYLPLRETAAALTYLYGRYEK
jgi:hypothetical protein